MIRERLEDLSVYYYIKDYFSTYSQIRVVDEFPVEGLVLPTISIEAKSIEAFPFELGNKNRAQIRVWYIDVFAQNKSQRDEMGYIIMNLLEECIPVYNYDEGFPPDVTPSTLGCMDVQDLRMEIVRISPYLVDKLYYRCTVSFTAIFNQI
jgi:hypothetical protein